ncbi:cytochrome b-c1 complex subunit 8 [Arapaima gigas]
MVCDVCPVSFFFFLLDEFINLSGFSSPKTRSRMGRHFGDLARIRHIITFSLSPFEQRAFSNYFSKGIPNVWRRFQSNVFRVAPPMVAAYVTYIWGTHVHEQSKRKDPKEFENDQ